MMARKNGHRAEPATGRVGSDNIFADLGFAEPETELVKADLVLAIADRIERLELNQRGAAERLGTTQPKVSMLLRGHTKDFSIGKLMELLNRLSCDVQIAITPATEERARGATRVTFGKSAKKVEDKLFDGVRELGRPGVSVYTGADTRVSRVAQGKAPKGLAFVPAKPMAKAKKSRVASTGARGKARQTGGVGRGRSR
jgi:predicted XRE-type DNA-binding protein